MVILGLDPGTTRVGYGVIKSEKGNLQFLKSGLLKISAESKNEKLIDIEKSLIKLIKEAGPELAAVEKLYFAKNVKTALQVSEARGVILLTITKNKIPLLEYTPLQIKQAITGYGRADKKAMVRMVTKILGMKKIVGGDDAADALAAAIAAAIQPRIRESIKSIN